MDLIWGVDLGHLPDSGQCYRCPIPVIVLHTLLRVLGQCGESELL